MYKYQFRIINKCKQPRKGWLKRIISQCFSYCLEDWYSEPAWLSGFTLTFDEAYYYLYSLHLDWSYFDHPLLVALTTGFGPWLTGVVSQFTIRLGTLIGYTGSLLLLYLTCRRLFSPKAAYLTLLICQHQSNFCSWLWHPDST